MERQVLSHRHSSVSSFRHVYYESLLCIASRDLIFGFWKQGSFEAMDRSCGCCGSCIEDEMQREHMETTCDFVTHVLCHTCALCQEGREIRRKVLHPGFNAQSTVVVLPPSEQTMGRVSKWKACVESCVLNNNCNTQGELWCCLLLAFVAGSFLFFLVFLQCMQTYVYLYCYVLGFGYGLVIFNKVSQLLTLQNIETII